MLMNVWGDIGNLPFHMFSREALKTTSSDHLTNTLYFRKKMLSKEQNICLLNQLLSFTDTSSDQVCILK